MLTTFGKIFIVMFDRVLNTALIKVSRFTGHDLLKFK